MRDRKKTYTAIAVILILTAAGCGKSAGGPDESRPHSPFSTFQDIPGITMGEIAEIEALQQKYESLSYGMTLSTESFLTDNSEIGGYSTLFCEWLTSLFGIRFQPEIHEWVDLQEKLLSGELDFAGNLTPTEVRQKIYWMTDPVAERQFKTIQLAGSLPLDRIALTHPLRYVFIEGAAIAATVASVTDSGTYEAVFVSDYEEAYRVLKSGAADAFIGDSAVVSAFDVYGDMYTEDFLPLIFSPVCMATAKAEFEPLISLVTRALQNGARPWLNYLYNQGYEAYRKNKFFIQLSDEEKAYLQNTASVPLAARYFNYPVDFYNSYEKKWEGIVFDVLAGVEDITGLKFEVANTTTTELSDLFNMVYDGSAHIMAELIYSERRAQYVIWTKHIFLTDQLALLSTSTYPNVSANEIPYKRVGVIANTVRAEMFHRWFPGAEHITEFATDESAMHALQQDEIDLVMSSKNRLLSFLNFQDISLFKANFLFNYPYESTFGFHKEQTALCSIMDKALPLVDTRMITEQWLTKTYDYRTRLMEAQRPWLIGATVLSLVTLALILVLFFRTLNEGKRLVELVEERTKEVRQASEAKSRFVANMSHEMRTPMNAIVGLTDLMLEEDDVPGVTKETLKKINTAGNILTELINDILDISKIEAGKLELKLVEYDVPNLLNDIITINIIRIQGKPITFKLDIDENIPLNLFGDDLRIKQILNNLLSNAFKYTKNGTVTLRMKCWQGVAHLGDISTTRNPQQTTYYQQPAADSTMWVFFSISDTGIGIHEDDMKKLFTDYNQVDTYTNREIEGTGLGLSITKNFVELMGGEISVESEYGKGSTFRIQIRQGFVNKETIGRKTAEELCGFRYTDKRRLSKEKLVRADLSSIRVLVVDDFPTNLDVAAGMLRKYKMQVDCVTNGQDAVNLITAGEPYYNAVFMDHMMPGMDGVEATRLIRAIDTKYAKNIPIIALTANAVVGSKQMFLDSGFNAFLPKPFNAMILDSVIQQWVGTGEQEKNTVEHGMTEKTEKIVFEGEILICEDNIMNQDLICERLVRAGLKTVAAENGKEGVEMVLSRMQSNTKPFDMIFMDIFMPVMDGLEAATEITKLNTGTPIVAMTSNITSADREKYSAHGMSDSLSKPFTSKELSDCLMKHLKPLSPVGRNVADISFQIEKKFIQDDDLRFEEDLKNKFIRIFVNNNKTKYDEIAKAVNDGDIKTAHRLAHSLKGNAGMIGKTRLQKAAEDVEMLLNEENLDLASVAKHPAMGVLKAELEAVINNEQ